MNEKSNRGINKDQIIMELDNICKSYCKKDKKIDVLSLISIKFCSNNFYAIKGHSGSGKSTLINILGLIDNYDKGDYNLYDTNSLDYNDNKLSRLRMQEIGFIFQGIYLNKNLKAYENVMVPMLINEKIERKNRKKIAIELLKSVGLIDRIEHYPKELSGGEQQRVAIARALANNPNIILADEPTGNLDENAEKEIFELLRSLSKEGKCVIVVSHSNVVNLYSDITYEISNGKLVEVK